MKTERIQILLTNDDGIESPGLWAAAEALSRLGYVTVAAPRDQYSGAGRSHPLQADGTIRPRSLQIGSQIWTAYAIGGSPAQTVMLALLDLLPRKPDLVVSGINYGENVGSGITVSGTLGAAMEAASFGIPALAVSLELPGGEYYSHSRTVNFACAAHFTALFAEKMLTLPRLADVDLLKVEVPASATPETPWRAARLSRHRYFNPITRRKDGLESPVELDFTIELDQQQFEPDSDVYVLRFEKQVAVTPISLDMTSRLALGAFEQSLRG
ncbi:MAG: 5'/3'-nucleotidase SurE [Bellilinea sp.]|jgi:5'-nucleotidase